MCVRVCVEIAPINDDTLEIKSETCLTYQMEPGTRHSQGQTGRQPARDKDEDEDEDEVEDMDEASFREINFN